MEVEDFSDIFKRILIKLQGLFRSFILPLAQSPTPQLTSRRILEMIHKISRPLDSSISQFTYFLTIETIPSSAIELLVKIKDELRVDKVHKSIAHITGVVMVDRQIQKIDLHSMVFANLLEQHLL